MMIILCISTILRLIELVRQSISGDEEDTIGRYIYIIFILLIQQALAGMYVIFTFKMMYIEVELNGQG